MFSLQIAAPIYLEVKVLVVLLEDLDRLCVSHMPELGVHYMLQALDEALVHKLVKELHLLRRVGKDIADDILEHRFRILHVVLQIRKRHLRLDHPEFGRMAGRVGLLRAESGSECIYIAESEREGLDVQLTADCQVGGLSEEILGVVYLAVLGERKLVQRKGCNLEHLACAFRVTARDNGGVHIDEASLHEEGVDRIRDQGAHAVCCRKSIGAGTKVRDRSEVFKAVTLLLQRIIGCGSAFQLDLLHLHLQRLLGIRRKDDLSGGDDGRADVHLGDLREVLQVLAVDQLQILEAGAVCQRDKSDRLGITVIADPSANCYRLVRITFFAVKEPAYRHELIILSHSVFPRSFVSKYCVITVLLPLPLPRLCCPLLLQARSRLPCS